MGIEIATDAGTDTGSVLRPLSLQLNSSHANASSTLTHPPFKYYTDAIIGLCYHKLTDFKFVDSQEKLFIENAYLTLNPYIELFRKSAPRVQSLTKLNFHHSLDIENFEKKITEAWHSIFLKGSVDFSKIQHVLDIVSDFENKIGSPFLYNFSLQFSERFQSQLIAFYSFLFHLRSVVAIDHNAYVEDSSIESVKCDSISDYLSKADYTINDALLFWHFKKLSVPFVGQKDTRTEKNLIQPLETFFNQYNHNACCLIEQLPFTFLNSLTAEALDETLHHVQMDWLLGSASGLLFKIREELFGLVEGYDKIFWPEALNLKSNSKTNANSKLTLIFQISNADLNREEAVA